jgi:hypothetical protein
MRREKAHRATWTVVMFNQYNLLFLAGAGVFSLALASPRPAIIGLGAEVLWLVIALTSRRVRRWAVRHVLEQDRAHRLEESAALLRTLDPAYSTKVEKLEAIGADIRRLVWERHLEGALFAGSENRLESLLRGFGKMAALHQRLLRFVGDVSPNQLEQELVGLGQSLSAEKDPSVRFLMQQAVSIAQRRFEQQEQLGSQVRLLGVKMGTLEMSLDYLRSQIFGGRSKQELSTEIAQMVGNLTFLMESESEISTSVERLKPTVMPAHPQIARGS